MKFSQGPTNSPLTAIQSTPTPNLCSYKLPPRQFHLTAIQLVTINAGMRLKLIQINDILHTKLIKKSVT